MEPMSIDASIWEGGGQIFRNSMSLSVIMKKTLTIHSIRSNRPTPGLHNQALAVVRVIQSIFKGECSNASLGCTELVYTPSPAGEQSSGQSSKQSGTGKKLGGYYPHRFEENVGSAGSLTLVLQALLPCVLLCGDWSCRGGEGGEERTVGSGTNSTASASASAIASSSNANVDITLIGGTNVSFSPPAEHFLCVLVPLLAHMGVHVTTQLVKRGFFPRGGGQLHLSRVALISTEEEGEGAGAGRILPITLTSQGTFTRVEIFVYVSPEDCRVLDQNKQTQDILIEAENVLKHNLMTGITELLSRVRNTVDNIPIFFSNVKDGTSTIINSNMASILPPPPPASSKTQSQSQTQAQAAVTAPVTTSASACSSTIEEKINTTTNYNKQNEGKKQKVIHAGGRGKPGGKHQHHHQQKAKKVAITLGALVCLHTTTGCVISADSMMNERDHNKFDHNKASSATSGIVNTILSRLDRTISSGACIDEQTSDQLLIYMSLASGTSEILCAPLCANDHSQHIEAAIDVISQFTHRQFVVEVDPKTKCRLIRCESE